MPDGENGVNGVQKKEGLVPGERQLRTDVKPFVPNQGESFEEAKARYKKLIRQSDIDHWNEHGYVIIKDFLTTKEFEDITASWQRLMPDWDEYKSRSSLYNSLIGSSSRNGPGSNIVRYDFPYPEDSLNQLAVHPYLMAFAEMITGQEELALSLGHVIGKYAGKGDYEQALHSDYSNNSLVIPQKRKEWIDIPMIVYLTDVTLDLGPTHVLSQKHTEHRGLLRHGFRPHTKEDFPELYEHEVPVVVPAGSVVIYSMRTFHRGSAMKAKEGCRIVQFAGYHSANVPWMAPMDQQSKMGSVEFNRFLEHADPRQRQVVGFPPVGHEYWNDEEILEAVGNRYPGMDMRPYGGGPAKRPLESK